MCILLYVYYLHDDQIIISDFAMTINEEGLVKVT